MKKVIYLSYDLGVNGDYTSLYKWLAHLQAIECGDSMCRLVYDFTSIGQEELDGDYKKALTEIQNDIKASVNIKNGNRIYICSDFIVKEKSRLVGAFIIGQRKQNPWQEYEHDDGDMTFDE